MRREWNYLYDMAFIGFMVSDSGPSLSQIEGCSARHTQQPCTRSLTLVSG